MGNSNAINQLPPNRAIVMIRIIWGALLMGQFAFMGVEAVIFSQPLPPGDKPAVGGDVVSYLLMANVAMLLTVVPAAGFVRWRTFHHGRGASGAIMPSAFSTGNIIFWAGCEGVSFFGLVIALLNRNFWPSIVCVVVAMALQIVTFPRLSQIMPRDQTFGV